MGTSTAAGDSIPGEGLQEDEGSTVLDRPGAAEVYD